MCKICDMTPEDIEKIYGKIGTCYRCAVKTTSKIGWKLDRYNIAIYNSVCFECVGNVLRAGRWMSA